MNEQASIKHIFNKKWLWFVLVITGVIFIVVLIALITGTGMVQGIQFNELSDTAAEVDYLPVDVRELSPSIINLEEEKEEFDISDVDETLDCLSCHSRTLSYHDQLGEGNNACWSCHVSTDMDKLHLADGTRVNLADSAILCGQCHQKRYTAWLDGTHGIPGTIAVVTCAACHNPHNPEVIIKNVPEAQPKPLDSIPEMPEDAAIITGISVILLIGMAIVLARRRENS